MSPFEYIVILFFLLLIGSGVILFGFRKKKLKPEIYETYSTRIHDTCTLDAAHSIMESHKLFVIALKTIGGQNKNAAKVIAQHQKRFPNIKKIWTAHRLRNQLAHEIGIKVTDNDAEKIRQTFIQALKSLT
jgi:hypothetical protein